MSENMKNSGVKPRLTAASPHSTASPLGPALGQETVQKPSLDIVEASENLCDERQCAMVGTGHVRSSFGGMRSQDGDQKKENWGRASTGKSLWNRVVKGFKTKSPNLTSISKSSVTVEKSREEPEKTQRKRTSWVQFLHNLFQPSRKKPNHHKGSEMSTFSFNYHVLGSEDSLPVMEHPQILKGDAAASSHCEIANSEQLAYHPLTSSSLPPPWVLRKWKLKDSQKFLRIDPAKEFLFHYDTKKQYTCSIKLENRTRRYVAFKFKSTASQGYLMRPKHGVLAPSTTMEVKGQSCLFSVGGIFQCVIEFQARVSASIVFVINISEKRSLKIGDPYSSAASKKDLFVVITLPIPASLMKENTSTVSSSIFERLQDQCCCEGVFHAVFSLPSSSKNVETDAVLDKTNLLLTSIPEG